MAINRLQLYNMALMLSGERSLVDLNEAREPRRLLDEVWNSNGREFALEQAQWWFAMRAVQIDNDPSSTPDFGYNYAFNVPEDWVSTSSVCQDPYFLAPLIFHAAEPDYWYAAITPIYVKYVSKDDNYGFDISRWPATFSDYVAAYFAGRILPKLSGDKAAQRANLFGPPGAEHKGHIAMTLAKAKNAAAMTQPTQQIAQGRWTTSRRGSRRTRGPFGDGGTTGSLIG